MTWLIENMGTIVVLLVLVILVALIVRKLYSDKKKGIHSCGGHCGGGCPGCSSCGGSWSSCSAHKK